MEQTFRAAYKQLNPAQKQAVDAIDGPVLVVAGPGTGKTQLLSVRVANILQTTDTDPSSVLCLTFTNFAAINMQARLTQLIGPTAQQVMVKTFHGFAAEIMNLYPDHFWHGARFQIAPDAVQLEIIQTILSRLPLDNPLANRFQGVYTSLGDVQQALKLTKEAGLTPDKLRAMLTVNSMYLDLIEPQLVTILDQPLSLKKLADLQAAVVALPEQPIDESVAPLVSLSTVLKESLAYAVTSDQASGKTTQTGKWKRRWLQNVDGQKGLFDERRRLAWWQALADVYEQYRHQLHGHGYYDYSDMLVEVIAQLEQSPALLSEIQDRFLYLLIDEFQDTNAAQLRLAHLIAAHGRDTSPNLMAVGDDDQNIFAFNGAELNNMLAFDRTYPATKVIVLQANYRSSSAILSAAQQVIGQAEDRLVKRQPNLQKKLLAKAQVREGTIKHLVYPTREQHITGLAERIKQACQDSDDSLAVLAYQHSSLRDLSAALNRLGVPIRYEQQNNILEQPLVQQIIQLSEVVVGLKNGDVQTVNHYLAITLQHSAWGLSPETLWQLALTNYPKPNWLESLLDSSDERLVTLGQWLLWLSRQSVHEALPVMLEYLIGLRASRQLTSPLREYFLISQSQDEAYLLGLSGLNVLRHIAQEFVQARPGQTRLKDFVRLIRLHQALNRPITDESWFVSAGRTVELMTVHKAKGLEFDQVFIMDAIDENWRPRRQGRRPPANLPMQPYGEQYDDYVRLLYVAATRARHSLIVSSFGNDWQGKSLLPTPLIQHLSIENITDSTEPDRLASLEQALRWPRLEAGQAKAWLAERLSNYRLSSTGLLDWLDVSKGGPNYFLERHLLRLPEITTANMAYGTALHQALQTAQQLTTANKFNLKTVLKVYGDSLSQQALPQTELKRYLAHGEQIIKTLFKTKDFKLDPRGLAEVALDDVRLGEAHLTGKLDHVLADDDQLLITDYKTGRPLTNFATKDQTKVMKAWRHNRQLSFYILLAQASGRFKAIKDYQAQAVYVEAETINQLKLPLTVSTEALNRLSELINKVWQHIMDLNFPDTSHYPSDQTGLMKFETDLLEGKI